jgi:hypothetical protein
LAKAAAAADRKSIALEWRDKLNLKGFQCKAALAVCNFSKVCLICFQIFYPVIAFSTNAKSLEILLYSHVSAENTFDVITPTLFWG